MATLQDLQTALTGVSQDIQTLLQSSTDINTGIDNVLAALQALKDQIAQGANITQQDLDAVVAQAQGVDAAGEDVKAALESAKNKLTGV